MTSAKIKMALFLHIFLSHLAFTGIVLASQLQEMEKPGRKQETFFSTFGVVHKLRLQDELGRWSKNVHFLSTFIP